MKYKLENLWMSLLTNRLLVWSFFANQIISFIVAFYKIIHCVCCCSGRYGFLFYHMIILLRFLILLTDFFLAWVIFTHHFLNSVEWSVRRFFLLRYILRHWHYLFIFFLELHPCLIFKLFFPNVIKLRSIAAKSIVRFLESNFGFYNSF